jgi:predicted XRE-type DNA-binding protein
MWNALRSDLKEFVAVVTDPNASNEGDEEEVENPALEEALRRMGLPETYTQPLLPETAVGNGSEGTDTSTDRSDADESAVSREQIQDYVDSFLLETYEEEISRALDSYGDVLQPMLQQLVPETVSRKDFWMHYFFNCSVDRIHQEILEQENRERFARMTQSIQGVKSFLGVAVQSVTNSILEDDDGGVPLISPFHMPSMGNRRPPFVMNTAVDDDEDDEQEEELGWSDDEVDDDYDEADEEAQIEFKDAATEQLQEELKQALEERDMLHQTVELQQKQIAELAGVRQPEASSEECERLKMQLFEKESELAAFRSKEPGSNPPHGDESGNEIELKQLERENVMLKAALEAKESDDSSKEKLMALEKENSELKALAQSQTSTSGQESSDVGRKMLHTIEENAALKVSLESKESELQRLVESKELELTKLRQQHNEQTVVLKNQIQALEKDKKALEDTLISKNDELKAIRQTSESKLAELRCMLEMGAEQYEAKCRILVKDNMELSTKLEAKEAELVEAREVTSLTAQLVSVSCVESAESPASLVKVEVEPACAPIDVRSGVALKSDDGSDDWGDDWGNEDD